MNFDGYSVEKQKWLDSKNGESNKNGRKQKLQHGYI